MDYQGWAAKHSLLTWVLGRVGVIPGIIVVQRGGLHGAVSFIAGLFAVIITSWLQTHGAWFFASDGRRAQR